jgi:hypothetical protein
MTPAQATLLQHAAIKERRGEEAKSFGAAKDARFLESEIELAKLSL